MPYYAEDGCRLTDCCGCYSTYVDAGGANCRLCCNQCEREVEQGQGDGYEYKYKVIDDLVLNDYLEDN